MKIFNGCIVLSVLASRMFCVAAKERFLKELAAQGCYSDDSFLDKGVRSARHSITRCRPPGRFARRSARRSRRSLQRQLSDNAAGEAVQANEVTSQETGLTTQRELTEGSVVHYQAESESFLRREVAAAVQAALKGEGNFLLEIPNITSSSITFEDMTRNDMILDVHDNNLSLAFNVTNRFLVDEPGVMYKVACPAESKTKSDDDSCALSTLKRGTPVNCFSDEAGNALQDGLLIKCSNQVYDVKQLVYDHHFFLLAVDQDKSGEKGCPPNIALASMNGRKYKGVMYNDHFEHLPSIHLGSALLRDILDAEEQAEPFHVDAFNAMTNTCIHYARRIWHPLGLPDTKELASFLIENIMDSPHLEGVLKSNVNSGGRRALAALTVGGKDKLKSYIERVVVNQLELVDDDLKSHVSSRGRALAALAVGGKAKLKSYIEGAVVDHLVLI